MAVSATSAGEQPGHHQLRVSLSIVGLASLAVLAGVLVLAGTGLLAPGSGSGVESAGPRVHPAAPGVRHFPAHAARRRPPPVRSAPRGAGTGVLRAVRAAVSVSSHTARSARGGVELPVLLAVLGDDMPSSGFADRGPGPSDPAPELRLPAAEPPVSPD